MVQFFKTQVTSWTANDYSNFKIVQSFESYLLKTWRV